MNEFDDFFGSEIVKRRHDTFSKIKIMGTRRKSIRGPSINMG
jgi:hypothetical protein